MASTAQLPTIPLDDEPALVVHVGPDRTGWVCADLAFMGMKYDLLASFHVPEQRKLGWLDGYVTFTPTGMTLNIDEAGENTDLVAAMNGPISAGATQKLLRDALSAHLRSLSEPLRGVSVRDSDRTTRFWNLIHVYDLPDLDARAVALAMLDDHHHSDWPSVRDAVAAATSPASTTPVVADTAGSDQP